MAGPRDEQAVLAAQAAEQRYQDTLDATESKLSKLHGAVGDLKDQREAMYKVVDAEVEMQQAYIKLLNDEIQLEEQRLEVTRKQLAAGTATQADYDAQAASLEDMRQGHHNLIEATEKTIKDNKKLSASLQEMNAAGKGFAETMFGMNNGLMNFAEKLDEAAKAAGGGPKGMLTALKALTQGALKSIFSFKNLGAQVLKVGELLMAGAVGFVRAMVKLALAQDEAVSGFMKATGAGMEFSRAITDAQRDVALYGVDAAEAGKAATALYQGFSDFTQINKAEAKNLIKTVSLLAELGVSAETSAKILDVATRSLGLNVAQSEELLRDIKATSDAIGLPAGQLAADFAASAPQLTKYGGQMMDVFTGLAEQAKKTGIEINKLLGFTAQFDTFEGAGKAVGRLNAILGGPYLNSIDMLNATDEERIEILQRLTDQAGLQFDQLGRYEQMAIASAMGTDVDTARRMFGQSQAVFEKQALAQERLAEQAAKAQTIIDQLKAAFNAALINMRPFIEDIILPIIYGLRDMAGGGEKFTEVLGRLYNQVQKFLTVVGALAIIAGVMLLFTGAGAVFGVPMIMTGLKMLGVGMAMKYAAGGAEKLGTMAKEKVESAQTAGAGRASAARMDIVGAAAENNVPGFAQGGVMTRTDQLFMKYETLPGVHKVLLGGGLALAHAMWKQKRGGSLGVVGEHGPELIEAPTGSRVTPAGTTERLVRAIEGLNSKLDAMQRTPATGGSSGPIILQVEGREFARVVGESLDSPELRRKLLMGYT